MGDWFQLPLGLVLVRPLRNRVPQMNNH